MRAPTLLLAAFATLAAAPPTKPAAPAADDTLPQPVAAAILPGPAHDAARRLLLKPYADATATDPAEAPWNGSADALRGLVTAHAVDLVLLDGATLTALCKAAVLDKIDWSTLGRDRFEANTTSDCGAGAYVSATILAWDKDKLTGTPTWSDFWDVAKHPGRRGLRHAARGTLEFALMADGVGAGDVYRTLRSSDGVDRAFRKLDQLKPYILWWDQPSQPAQLLAGAKVLLTSAPSYGLPPDGPKIHVGTQWAGSLQEVVSWARPAGAPHPRGAAAALGVATDPARIASFARVTGLGPVTKTAIALLPGDARAQNPSTPANQQGAVMSDDGFWAENGDRLEARFTAWAGK